MRIRIRLRTLLIAVAVLAMGLGACRWWVVRRQLRARAAEHQRIAAQRLVEADQHESSAKDDYRLGHAEYLRVRAEKDENSRFFSMTPDPAEIARRYREFEYLGHRYEWNHHRYIRLRQWAWWHRVRALELTRFSIFGTSRALTFDEEQARREAQELSQSEVDWLKLEIPYLDEAAASLAAEAQHHAELAEETPMKNSSDFHKQAADTCSTLSKYNLLRANDDRKRLQQLQKAP
jgi:hypothetical protein